MLPSGSMLKHFLACTQGVQQQTARDGGAKLNSNPQQDSGEDPPIEFQPSCCAHVSDSHICQRNRPSPIQDHLRGFRG